MNRLLPALLLLFALTAGAASAAGLDVVAMVDTSASMFPYFGELQEYLLRDLLEKWLHKEDSLHLLSFADVPELEIAERITGPRELEAVIDRIYLLQALGHYTDLVAALDFLYAYLDSLPADSPKLVLLMTDGVHDPPPGSPNQGGAEQVRAALERNAERIRLRGWNIHILRMPGSAEAALSEPTAGGPAASAPPAPAAGEAPSTAAGAASSAAGAAAQPGLAAPADDLLSVIAGGSGGEIVPYGEGSPEALTGRLTGFPTLQFPGHLGRVGRRFDAPFAVTNPNPHPLSLTLLQVKSSRTRLLSRPLLLDIPAGQTLEFQVPLRLPPFLVGGEQELPVSLSFAEEHLRVSPQEGVLAFDYAAPRGLGPVPFYVLYVLIAAVLAFLVFLLTRLLRNRARDVSFRRFYGYGGSPGLRPLVMKVLDQNPYIGTRNIHSVPPGRSRSVGGDGSAFLIYYLSMPKRIGDIRNDGRQYVFVPRRRERFVSLDKPLIGCLDVVIEALSLRDQVIRFVFHEYVPPAEAINRLMLSVRKVRDQSAARVS